MTRKNTFGLGRLVDPRNEGPSFEAYWSRMKKGSMIDAWGLARETSRAPIGAEQFLKGLVAKGLAVREGNWYGLPE